MMRFRTTLPLLIGCATLVWGGLATFADDRGVQTKDEHPLDAALQDVLTRFDAVQDTIRTLSADLTMTTVSPLLKDPVVYSGRLYMTKPDAVRWEFDSPEEMRFVIADDLYTGYYPAQKRAERKSIKRWSTQLFRYLGVGQESSELAKFYRISLAGSDEAVAGTHLLVLEPRKRRARKRVEDVRFWIDAESLLPVKVEYRSVDGNLRVVEFGDVQLNVDLARSLFSVDLPSDVEVSTSFSPFGGS